MTRVIHTGDTHLGYRQYHRPERREDFLAAFRRVAEDAVEDDVDALVHAGDLFHDRRPDLPDILGTLSILRDLADADVPFLAIVGNHETKRDAQWLDLFESMGLATRLSDDPVTVGDTAFYGLDFVPRSRRDDLDYDFEPHDAANAALVAHGLFEPFDYADWDTERLLAESTVDFDAVLLGDNHEPQKAEIEDTWITYCGSTERASADEREDRGYNIVEFDEQVSIRRRGLPTREFVFVEVELDEGEGVERVRERVGQYDLDDAVVVVHIEGEGDPVAPASIEEYADEAGALVARVTDHREVTDSGEIDVNFADPDDAVAERIREMGLSEAARDIDETVRASKTADSNVTDEVERRVRDILDEGDDAAFRAAESETADADPTGESATTDDAAEPTPTEEPTKTDGGDAGEEQSADAEAGPDSDPDTEGNGQPSLGDFE
ncbi:DNA double-strand break repair protein Mre11 [Halorientalis regularis]|uniref:DNA double-strand break repair protein Mre11 n=1 Tax=Halorientalis regularis TaxID=660518 RepID=A0A1G7PCJ8_9EURY|nr:DNA double-strand break repair protein Mre11 [Halorientalis regularis]SDF83837.1 DNA repair exonuclease SbcCD nuclease subunit [Halorientalis regularis]